MSRCVTCQWFLELSNTRVPKYSSTGKMVYRQNVLYMNKAIIAFIVYIVHACVLSIMNSSASWEIKLNIFLSNENVSQKYIYTCIYHMVTGYDLGHIKAPEYFRTGRNIIRTCNFSEYIFFTSGYWTVLFVQQITYLFVVHAIYFAIRNLREYFSDTLQNPSTLRARDLMFWTTRVNLLWSVGRESFILGAMSRYLSTLLSGMHIFT